MTEGVTERPERRRPGRRKGTSPGEPAARNTILDVAEELFGSMGYLATPMRVIAQRAGVTQALIAYYFRSKQELFETVFRRRAVAVVEQRLKLLQALRNRPHEPPTVREIVRAYLAPQFAARQTAPWGLNFARIEARLPTEPDEIASRLRREVYDPSTREFIAELERTLPASSSADIYWRMMFSIGTYLYMVRAIDRLAEMSDGRFRAADDREILERMTEYIVAGFLAPPSDFVLPVPAKGQACF